MEKQCTRCSRLKPVEAFNKHARSKGGLASQCRDCAKEGQQRWMRENPETTSEMRARSAEYGRQVRAETRKSATSKGARWSAEEDAELMRTDLTLKEICKLLGRTYGSACMRRTALREQSERLAVVERVQQRMAR